MLSYIADKLCAAAGHVALVLSGSVLSVPYGTHLPPLVKKLKLNQDVATPQGLVKAASTSRLLSPLSALHRYTLIFVCCHNFRMAVY